MFAKKKKSFFFSFNHKLVLSIFSGDKGMTLIVAVAVAKTDKKKVKN